MIERAVDLVHLAAGGAATDRALEQAVGGEAVGAVDEEREVVVRVAGGGDRPDLELARPDDVTIVDRLVDVDAVGTRERMSEDGDAEAPGVFLAGDDMVVMVMGDENVGDGDPEPLRGVDQRLVDAVRVDEDAVAAFAVGNEVGIRQPRWMLCPLDDHPSRLDGLEGRARGPSTMAVAR